MGLSAQQMELLQARYELWGLDQVRRELARGNRDRYVNSDVTAFARAWIKAKETRHHRMRLLVPVLTTFCIVLISAVLIGVIDF